MNSEPEEADETGDARSFIRSAIGEYRDQMKCYQDVGQSVVIPDTTFTYHGDFTNTFTSNRNSNSRQPSFEFSKTSPRQMTKHHRRNISKDSVMKKELWDKSSEIVKKKRWIDTQVKLTREHQQKYKTPLIKPRFQESWDSSMSKSIGKYKNEKTTLRSPKGKNRYFENNIQCYDIVL